MAKTIHQPGMPDQASAKTSYPTGARQVSLLPKSVLWLVGALINDSRAQAAAQSGNVNVVRINQSPQLVNGTGLMAQKTDKR